MTEAQASYTATSSFPVAGDGEVVTAEVKALTAETKAMTFTTATTKPSTGTTDISVGVLTPEGATAIGTGATATSPSTNGQVIVMATEGKTGVCYMEADNETSATTQTGSIPPGVSYAAGKPVRCGASATADTTTTVTVSGTKTVTHAWATKYPKVTP